ncbi:hypothetical protein [Dactylosporangium sp. NPDC049140]|jgi:hypothetical protein|uniref:hypothetical protein n=1 Tax=Dactylosporangium sp. NPDC049140 TaxID=3155647 RepID=UPI003400015E
MTDAFVILTLAENDYLYGTGTITIRVRQMHSGELISYHDETWYEIHGVQLGPTGRELGERTVLVRAARLR